GALTAPGTTTEYRDRFDTMGGGTLGQYTTPHKIRLGWIDGATSTRTVESNGDFSLVPAEDSSGLRALKVRRGTGNDPWLRVEYRQKKGSYDTGLYSQVYSGALVHYEYPALPDGHTMLVDFTPGSIQGDNDFHDPALANGKMWQDPYSDLSIRVTSATAQAL